MLCDLLCLVRLLRLLRVLSNSKRYQILFGTVMDLMPVFLDVMAVLFLLLHMYATVGVQVPTPTALVVHLLPTRTTLCCCRPLGG